MGLQRLDIYRLRNIREIKVPKLSRINIIIGANGAGKTSFLEAIYALGMGGRSFRGSVSPSLLIEKTADSFTVFGELCERMSTELYIKHIGLTRSRDGQLQANIDHKTVHTSSALVKALPVQIINTEALQLIDGEPKIKRQFMDWSSFHVKPEFSGAWKCAQRCLRQRNAILRQQADECNEKRMIQAWDGELSQKAKIIDEARQGFVKSVLPTINCFLRRISEDLPEIAFSYRRGWSEEKELATVLSESLVRDKKGLTTTFGPHRAMLDIMVDKRQAADTLSRGQKKLVVSAMKLAQGQHFMENTDKKCIFLIDDLPSELDRIHRNAFCRLLDEIGCQVFMTTTDLEDLSYKWRSPEEVSLFHVEHGKIVKN